jgi:hypothetical protein
VFLWIFLRPIQYDAVNKHTANRTTRSVGMVDRLRTEKHRNRGSVPGKAKSILHSPKRFRIGFWARPDFCWNGSWVVSVQKEWSRRGSDLSHLSNFEVKYEWAWTSSRPYAFLRNNSIHTVGSSKRAQVVRFRLLIWRDCLKSRPGY